MRKCGPPRAGAPSFRLICARLVAAVLSGTFSGVQVAYLATDRDLGVLIEIFSGNPKAKKA
jgi:hypothetical protein